MAEHWASHGLKLVRGVAVGWRQPVRMSVCVLSDPETDATELRS